MSWSISFDNAQIMLILKIYINEKGNVLFVENTQTQYVYGQAKLLHTSL